MHLPTHLSVLILVLTTTIYAARPKPERVLLSNVKSLTLRKDLKTTHNRVSAAPQLACIGGTAKGLYEIDVLRCKNAGSSYGDEDIQWTCAASLPSEFKLGSTDVICEGFASSDDEYVLKGSCGVEYCLMLTDIGEEKYGRKGKGLWDDYKPEGGSSSFVSFFFWAIFISVICWMLYAAFIRDHGPQRPGNRPGFGGWGGGGGDNDDPPPPYDYHPSPKPKASSSNRAPRAAPAQAQPQAGWRPGFWTGALGGAAAGYAAGNRGQNQHPRTQEPQMRMRDNGEGSSRWGGGGGGGGGSNSSAGGSYGSSRHESSGFGGTSRR